jgi:hypothetical protein
VRSSEDTRDFALWSTRNVTIGRERVGMYTMNATRSINDLRVRNNLATPRGAELRTTQKGSEIIACMCNSERPVVENSLTTNVRTNEVSLLNFTKPEKVCKYSCNESSARKER